MTKVQLNDSILTAIADAIRSKLNVSTTYKPSQMALAIGSIHTPAVGSKNITENGTYTASTDELDGYSSVKVNVSGGGSSDSYSAVAVGVHVVSSTAASIFTSFGDIWVTTANSGS